MKILGHCIEHDIPALLVGPTGTGKSSAVRQLSTKSDHQLVRIPITGQTGRAELVGQWLLRDGDTYWQDGLLVSAMKHGHHVVVDEINAALPEITFVLHSMLDDDRYVVLTEKDGEIVEPAESFRFFATMNPTEEYAGTKELNKAFLSRFPVVLNFDYPDSESEAKAIKDHVPGFKIADARSIVVVANELRKLKASHKIFYTCSTRDLISWATMWQEFGRDIAFVYSVLYRAGSTDAEGIKSVYAQTMGRLDGFLADRKVGSLDDLLQVYHQQETELKAKSESVADRERKVAELEKRIAGELSTKVVDGVLSGLGSNLGGIQ